MNMRTAFATAFVLLAFTATGQQPEAARPAGKGPTGPPPIIVYRIDLVPTGYMFAMNEPVLQGDAYVFRTLPERTEMRLPKVKVKSVARWSTDYSKEVVWQVDVVPSGSYLARDEPVKKGKNWVAHAWKQGQLVTMPQADVQKITRLTGAEAFKAQQIALGLIVLAGESTTPGFKGGNGPVNTEPAPGAESAAPAPGTGNWTYQGTPGQTDAYAPAGGTVAKPGDVPLAPTPR